MILLSEEKIESLVATLDDGYTVGRCSLLFLKGLAKAQLKKVVEWGNGYCVHKVGREGLTRKNCHECWEALQKEIE